ncbi:transcriptional regulator [Virgisporangium aliadipatigenens]|uniref:Transcriptional regulator n=1 Tax=Virgisporangium aliadipatigenens TaxID=741659 RepID=A0A8J3YNU5_9ACTN|nr:helix-turn-helix domain-containing protein [Virgisporangium aliadipatigenens]GIJ48989.1 transcriptional regulator [Virgisporangium aliadipatigenens]
MHRVVVLALDGVFPFELSMPGRIFDSVPGGAYEVVTCSVDGGPVRTSSDYGITVGHGPEALATADTVIIPAFSVKARWFTGRELPEPVRAAFDRIRPGTRIVSICTGSFVLAAAGLLAGRRATTHWRHTERFAELFPDVELDQDVLFVDDGDVLTSAGAAAGVDLCLHIVRLDHGAAVANQVARYLIVPPWRDGGQAQFIERPVPPPSTSSTAATREWALERLHEPIALVELARHARTSVRTFTRRFREEVGVSPAQWLINQRVDLARHLLETTDLGVDHVARRAGFGTAASMRAHLRDTIGVSPSAYRHTFRRHVERHQGSITR